MESENHNEKTNSVTKTANNSSRLIIKLHPLIVMNISDHWTRMKAQHGSPKIVYGAIIGKQDGRVLELVNSFELLFETIDDEITVNRDYYYSKEEQFKQVFEDLDFYGWYSTGNDVSEDDIKIHNQISSMVENPILLKLNTEFTPTSQNVKIYESVIDIESGNARFLPLSYSLTTEEAERIGIDHVAKATNAELSNKSAAAEYLRSQHSSITMLYTRIRFILNYLQAVQKGQLPCDHQILRSAHALCRRLPALGGEHVTEELHEQYNDITLMLYLAIMNKGSQNLNQLIAKLNVVFDTKSRRAKSFMF